MRKKLVIAAVGIGVLAACLAIWLAIPSPKPAVDPTYQGKPLSQWVLDLGQHSNYAAANAVLVQADTNVIPVLLQMVSYHEFPLRPALVRIALRLHLIKPTPHAHPDANDINNSTMEAFRLLGPKARGAIPDLIRIYDRAYSPNSQNIIAFILAGFGPDARAAIPSLVRETSNRGDVIRNSAFHALGEIHEDQAVVVPVLIRGLNDSYATSRYHAALGLGNFGTNAHGAVPILISFIKTNMPGSAPSSGWPANPGQTALDSLKKIDPAAADKLEGELATNIASLPLEGAR